MHVFVCDFRKGNILSQMQWMGLALRKGTMNIPCIEASKLKETIKSSL
jgi:hypothetical protein